MPAPQPVRQFVARFEESRETHASGRYNEAQLRSGFLDNLFEGWTDQ